MIVAPDGRHTRPFYYGFIGVVRGRSRCAPGEGEPTHSWQFAVPRQTVYYQDLVRQHGLPFLFLIRAVSRCLEMTIRPLMSAYGRLPLAFTRGVGCWLYDEQGNRYLDAVTGIAVCGLGHTHPAVTEAIQRQAAELLHCSNYYTIPLQVQLAERLCQIVDMEAVFFANSGAEANEAALKLARLHGHRKGIARPAIIVMEQAYHGRTLATLSASGNRALHAGFEPLMSGFVRVPFNSIAALEAVARTNADVVAVLLEPVQGEAGVRIASPDYLQAVRALCTRQDWLMILDEIQSGNGRTGRYFNYQHHAVTPDIVTTAKGLGNGMPIGACLARGVAADLFRPGHHGSTFGGNPLACAAALAVVQTIERERLATRAATLGERILGRLNDELGGSDYIRDIRGCGLMIGIEMADACPEIVPLAHAQGLLLNVTAERVIRLLPPLTLSDGECDELIERLIRLIRLYAGDDRRKPRH